MNLQPKIISNSLKTFFDIVDQSSSQEHRTEDCDIPSVSDHITENYDVGISDYTNSEMLCSDSAFSRNQLEHEIFQTSLAYHSEEYSSSSNRLHSCTYEII